MANGKKILTQAIQAGARLVGQFNQGPTADPVRTKSLFDELTDAIKKLPPGILNPNFANNLQDWEKIWLTGQYPVARYQMVYLVRMLKLKLRRCKC